MVTTPLSLVIVMPSLAASSFILSTQARTLPLSGPWTTITPSGLSAPTPFIPSEMLVTADIGSKPHLSLNSASFFWASSLSSCGSTNFFHSGLFWSDAKLRPITISESAGRRPRSSPAAAVAVAGAAPPAATVPAFAPGVVVVAVEAGLFSLFLQAPAVVERASAATSQPVRMRIICSFSCRSPVAGSDDAL